MLCCTGWLQATKLNVLYTGSFFQMCTQSQYCLKIPPLLTHTAHFTAAHSTLQHYNVRFILRLLAANIGRKINYLINVYWILYVFFWVFPRRQIKFCRRFGTLCQVHLQRLDEEYEFIEYFTSNSLTLNYLKFISYIHEGIKVIIIGYMLSLGGSNSTDKIAKISRFLFLFCSSR
jgi:hypothetical protein